MAVFVVTTTLVVGETVTVGVIVRVIVTVAGLAVLEQTVVV